MDRYSETGRGRSGVDDGRTLARASFRQSSGSAVRRRARGVHTCVSPRRRKVIRFFLIVSKLSLVSKSKLRKKSGTLYYNMVTFKFDNRLIRSKNNRGKWTLPISELEIVYTEYDDGNVLLKTTKNDRIVLVRLARRIHPEASRRYRWISPNGHIVPYSVHNNDNIIKAHIIFFYFFIFKTFLHFLCTNGPLVF